MAAPSSSIKRKISELRNAVPFCSQSALSSIRQEIEKHGMPQKHTRRKENKACLESEEMSRYGPLLNSVEPHLEEGRKRGSSLSAKEGERVQIFYVNFLSLLAGVFYKMVHLQSTCLSCTASGLQASTNPGDSVYVAMKCTQGTF